MIRIENVSKVFHAGIPGEVAAVKQLSLTINEGEYIVVIGANGSGKSTLLNLLAGTIFPDSGTISIDKEEISRLPEFSRSKWIARVFQNPLAGTAPELSILENFRLASLRTRSKKLTVGTNAVFASKVRDRIAALGLDLENKMNQPVGLLSGGQRQALTLLMSVMDDARLLLLDEPTAALDPRTSQLILKIAVDLIKDYKLMALLVTHNLKDALENGSRILHMHEGVITRNVSKTEHPALSVNELFGWFN